MAKKGKRVKIIVPILVCIAITLIYIFWSSPELKVLDMYVSVANYTGINVGTDAIWFGTVPPSGTASRIVTLKNFDNWSRWVDIRTEGLNNWVGIESNSFLLRAGEERNVSIYVVVPKNAEYGNYTGKLYITFRRVLFGPI
jgi:hypothetical protein